MDAHPGTAELVPFSEEEFLAYVVTDSVTGHRSLIAAQAFEPGERICSFRAAQTLITPGVHTLQTGDDAHIMMEPSFLLYTNHSCDPNVFFDTTQMVVECLRRILPGDELTFFYPSTEWEMAEPFECDCGSADCLKMISGAAHLTTEVLKRYRLTAYIQSKREQMPSDSGLQKAFDV